ncbi:MAG: DUF2802 domain-containing protein [Desulfatiglans sp.]|nr:DUF2802 domain-containing protein [Desulfatiglans sp.]
MLYLTFEFWAVVLSGIGLLFSMSAMLCFKRNWARQNQGGVEHESGDPSTHFGEELTSHMMNQHTEIALELISGVIERERKALRQFSHKEKIGTSQSPVSAEASEKPEGSSTPIENSTARVSLMTDPYDEAARLADLGAGLEKICDELNMPRGEAELVLNLKKRMQGSYVKSQGLLARA